MPRQTRLIAILATASLAALAWQQQPSPEFDPRPPKLKRGIPKQGEPRGEPRPEAKAPAASQREIVTDADGRVIGESRAPSADSGPPDPFDKVREVMDTVVETLPNFVCDQLTFRSQGAGRPPEWKVRDRVTNEILFIDGKESYRDVKVKGKLLGKSGGPEKSGTWSTGDWITTQIDVVSPSSGAQFRFLADSDVGGRKARKYSYSVKQPNSHWKIEYEGYRIYPAYKGKVWIDGETNRVARVEMEAVNMPADYPMEIAEMTVENAIVKIAGQDYLLPVKAAALACERYGKDCTRNEIEFRNYRRFSAESTVSATDSSVTFDGEKDEKPKLERKKK